MESETRMPIYIPRMFWRLILLGGILFYISWLAVFGLHLWNDVGVYSVTIVLISFGLVGSFVYDEIEKKEREEAKED